MNPFETALENISKKHKISKEEILKSLPWLKEVLASA